MTRRAGLAIWITIAALGCRPSAPPTGREPPPTGAPAPAALDAVLARWDHDEHPDLRAVVIRRHGEIVAERYYNGETPGALHDIRSAGKSITSLLVGIAIDRGLIAGTAARMADLVPALGASAIGEARLDDLLTMRSGLDADDQLETSPGNEDKLDAAPDPVAFARAVPLRTRPGERYLYSSLTAFLVGLAVEHAAGKPLDDFAAEALFAPLGITAWRWQRDAAGHTKGQGNLSITARDFSKLGELVRQGGSYAGHRVVSERWIRDSLALRVRTSDVDPYADGYGYLWYAKTHRVAGRDLAVSFASGNGGNKIYVVPSQDLVVAITSSAYGRGYGQRRSQAILLAILDALAP
jgi:CubicO group peptidase (beta-lactamase class C family)